MQASSSFENGYHHFEVGTGSLVEIREVVARMKELSGNSDTELRFGVIAQRECEVMVPSIDLSAIHALGWQARYDLAEGISKTIAAERAR